MNQKPVAAPWGNRRRPPQKKRRPTGERVETRPELVALYVKLREEAVKIANHIVSYKGRVTSIEVFEEMRLRGIDPNPPGTSKTWIAPVFRSGNWVRIAIEKTGSKGRPVSVWARP